MSTTTTKATNKTIQTCLTYRIRPPVGLDKVLVKEIKLLNLDLSPRKIPGRNVVEVTAPQQILWHLLAKSRIAENIQVRMTKQFLARGEKELRQELKGLPWHCYFPMPDKFSADGNMFKMPKTSAKCHESKLYHTQMIRDILIEEINEGFIRRDYKKVLMKSSKMALPYNQFKKEWIAKMQGMEKKEIDKLTKQKLGLNTESEQSYSETQEQKTESTNEEEKQFKSLDEVRAEMRSKKEYKKNLKELSNIQINIVKDRAEVLIGTAYEQLHKHGYKPFVRWGVLKETLAASCILESGIIQKANKTGKLYLWDPFCGTGSFIIETLMMLLEQPVRMIEEDIMPYEFWPIHNKEEYEKFKQDINDVSKMVKKNEIDIQLIGSDISQKAIDIAAKNIDYADIQSLYDNDLISAKTHPIINHPMIFSQQFPKLLKDSEGNSSSALTSLKDTSRPSVISLYHGDFQDIGNRLVDQTNGFEDFTILTNVPYGLQSKEKQFQSDTDLQRTYRRFGRFLLQYPTFQKNAYVVAQAHHYGHKLSFEKFSNCGWSKELMFTNGGIAVHLLKLDNTQLSQSKETINAYKEIDGNTAKVPSFKVQQDSVPIESNQQPQESHKSQIN